MFKKLWIFTPLNAFRNLWTIPRVEKQCMEIFGLFLFQLNYVDIFIILIFLLDFYIIFVSSLPKKTFWKLARKFSAACHATTDDHDDSFTRTRLAGFKFNTQHSETNRWIYGELFLWGFLFLLYVISFQCLTIFMLKHINIHSTYIYVRTLDSHYFHMYPWKSSINLETFNENKRLDLHAKSFHRIDFIPF